MRVKTRILEQPYAGKPIPEHVNEGERSIGLSNNAHPNLKIVIIEGPGLGSSFDLSDGFLKIGRGDTQDIQLSDDDFISRENHAIVGFVPEGPGFAIFDGGKANRIWVNNTLVSGIRFLENGDTIRIGETSLRFMAF